MLIVNKLLPQGRGLAPALLKRAAAVVLDWDTRQKSRFDTEDSQGRALGVFLPRGSVVRGGDVLLADDGSLIKVIATPQPVMVVRPGESGSASGLLRAAYHLGNRHVAVDLQPERLQIEPDHVLADMLRQLGLGVTQELASFEPEGGAYASHAGHAHAHPTAAAPAPKSHTHAGHDHDHDHDHDHGHVHGHVHGPDCHHDLD